MIVMLFKICLSTTLSYCLSSMSLISNLLKKLFRANLFLVSGATFNLSFFKAIQWCGLCLLGIKASSRKNSVDDLIF